VALAACGAILWQLLWALVAPMEQQAARRGAIPSAAIFSIVDWVTELFGAGATVDVDADAEHGDSQRLDCGARVFK